MKRTLIALAALLQSFALAEEPTRVVVRKQGDDGVHTYRIPGLAVSSKGTLLAVFDCRNKGMVDLPADVDVGLMRSTDDGATWGKMQRIMDYDAAEPGSRGNGVGDPCIVADPKTGTIYVVALWSKGNRSWHGSGPGLTPDETGQLVISRSDDDGVTWSAPVSITPQVKDPAWRICFQGPGAGIVARDGAIVIPAQFKAVDNIPHSCFIRSTDGGNTWKISPPAIPGEPRTSESQIAELPDGGLLLSMRNETGAGQRAWAVWKDGKWSDHWLAATDPTCMASLLQLPGGKLVLSGPNDPKRRVAMTLRTSGDGGRTWDVARLLDPRPAAYSCMARLRDGSIGVIYETGEKNPYETLTFVRVRVE